MKMIQLLMERIDEELQDAHEYVKLALEYESEEPEAAALFARLSDEEMTHAKLLHELAVSCIDRLRKRGGVVPESMAAVYEYLHKKQIEKAETVKRYRSMT